MLLITNAINVQSQKRIRKITHLAFWMNWKKNYRHHNWNYIENNYSDYLSLARFRWNGFVRFGRMCEMCRPKWIPIQNNSPYKLRLTVRPKGRHQPQTFLCAVTWWSIAFFWSQEVITCNRTRTKRTLDKRPFFKQRNRVEMICQKQKTTRESTPIWWSGSLVYLHSSLLHIFFRCWWWTLLRNRETLLFFSTHRQISLISNIHWMNHRRKGVFHMQIILHASSAKDEKKWFVWRLWE